MTIQLFNGDCLEIMDKLIADGIKVDAVITDPPYGVTACKWDIVMPFAEMWKRLKTIRKANTPIILFAREPFTSKLIVSNEKEYKHKWVWVKGQSGSWFNARYMPLQIDEDLICFCKNRVNYYPIMRKGKMRKKGGAKKPAENAIGIKPLYYTYSDEYYPINILHFSNCAKKKDNVHPTQKPVDLLEYLIKTYTKENDTVLDFTMGSGTTGVACKNLNRNFIGIELDKKYFDIAEKRINETTV